MAFRPGLELEEMSPGSQHEDRVRQRENRIERYKLRGSGGG